MKLPTHVALVSDIAKVRHTELMKVAAALQKQVTRDAAPLWGLNATVSAFGSLEDVPLGYWPIVIVENVQDAAGVHLDKDGQPYALIEFGPTWSLTASHECLEMLVDPFGDRLVAGTSPKPRQGRVEFLVEVCDPSEDPAYSYTVNGIVVSDFYTPAFFDPLGAAGARYSFAGHITGPRRILEGGYLSWHDPVSDHWWQQIWFGTKKPTFRNLGVFKADDPRSIREIVDSLTPEMQHLARRPPSALQATWRMQLAMESANSASSRALRLRDQIRELTSKRRSSRR